MLERGNLSERLRSLSRVKARDLLLAMTFSALSGSDVYRRESAMKFISIFSKIREKIENFLPMTFGNLLMFFIVLYFIFLVGRMTWGNYQSNKSIDQEAQKVSDLEKELVYMKYQIAYYKTSSFKEKEAREKLGYKAAGEKVLVLPLDTLDENSPDAAGSGDVKIKIPNQNLWWSYFFK